MCPGARETAREARARPSEAMTYIPTDGRALLGDPIKLFYGLSLDTPCPKRVRFSDR